MLGLNVLVEETVRLERMCHAALYWWLRATDPDRKAREPPAEWMDGVATLADTVHGVETALRDAEARYLGGQSCLFAERAVQRQGLRGAIEAMTGAQRPRDGSARELGVRRVRQVTFMARADGLDVVGWVADADVVARAVANGAA